jgi:putative DNA primase/helicase
VDRAPDEESESRAVTIFRRLVAMDAEHPSQYRFSSDAQQLFVEWLALLEAKVRAKELHPALISHLSKYRKLMPALALLFELADRAAVGQDIEDASPTFSLLVSLEHARQAAAWCDYLESHARRIFSCVTTPQMRAAQILAEKLKNRKVAAEGCFTCRDIYLKGWSGLDNPELVKMAAEVLQDAGWIRAVGQESGAFGGRPSSRYVVNPKVWK